MKANQTSVHCFMKCVIVSLCLLMTLFISSCSDQSNDTWYQDSSNSKKAREEYIRTQVEQGVDPAEARSLYDINNITIQTEGKDPSAFR